MKKKNIVAFFGLVICILSSVCFARVLEITLKTETYKGYRSPNNALAIWMKLVGGKQIYTLSVMGPNVEFMLKHWRTAAGLMSDGQYDGITSATRKSHKDTVRLKWNVADSLNNPVPDGEYEFWAEILEDDYFWGQMNPDEVYLGKAASGTILIGASPTNGSARVSEQFPLFKTGYNPTAPVIGGIRPNTGRSTFRAWYNRSSSQIIVNIKEHGFVPGRIRIMNLNGRVVAAFPLTGSETKYTFSLGGNSGAANGMLFVEAVSDNGVPLNSLVPLIMHR